MNFQEAQEQVRKFKRKMGYTLDLWPKPLIAADPKSPDELTWMELVLYLETGIWQGHLMHQEASELEEAWVKRDLVKLADAIGDQLYLAFGQAVTLGIDIEPIFKEICRSNLTKEPKTVMAGGGMVQSGGGHPKGKDYQPPLLEPILREQGFNV